MWIRVLGAALLLGACSSREHDDTAAAVGNPTAPAERHADAPTPPSPAALEAKRIAQRYFDDLKHKRYADAYRLWGNGGADAGGTAKAFAASFAPYASYVGEAGAPGPIRVSGGVDYILVEAKADTLSTSGKRKSLSGVVMMKRPAAGGATAAPWTIWGTDIRDRRCGPWQTARGLGCS